MNPSRPLIIVHVSLLSYLALTAYLLLYHLSPLQGPLAPTTQIPICVSPLLLLLTLLVLDTGLGEYGCAFTVNANMDNESRLSAMAENENKHMNMLLFFL